MSKFYTAVETIGSTVYVREIVDGIPNTRKDHWSPTLYVRGKPRDTTTKFKTLYGEDVYSVQPGSIVDCKEFVEKYKGVDGFDIFGQLNYSLQYMNEYAPIGFDYKYLSAWSIDIETKIPVDANGRTYFPTPKDAPAEVLLITMVNMQTQQAFTFGQGPYSGKDTKYTACIDEANLLKQFLLFWEQVRPDVLTGWYINGFDVPYLVNRIGMILGEDAPKRLSVWGRTRFKHKIFKGKDEFDVKIYGLQILDYRELYEKYVLIPRESYKLEFIASEELGTTKLDHSEHANFTSFYTNDWNKFVAYNIIDAQLVRMLDDKLHLIAVVMTMAYEANVNYEDVSSPVKLWDAIVANHCFAEGVVMPQQKYEESKHLDGAYVKDPVPGWYKNVVSLDATSLYPSIMMTNNISPETYVGNCGLGIDDFLANVEVDVDDKYIVTPAGAIYSKDKRGVLPILVEKYMKMRKAAKVEMLRLEQEYEQTKGESLVAKIASYDHRQMAFKVALNSLYGGTANKFFRFYKHDHAASITLTGQYVLRTIENQIDTRLNVMFGTSDVKYLIYIDTDSLYFTLDKVFEKYGITDDKAIKTIEKLAKDKITPLVNEICTECCNKMRSFDNKLSFKLEVAADKAIWVAKKKYALRVHSSEGVTYAKPKFKAKGLEMVKSSTPAYVRGKLKDALDVIFNTTQSECQKFISEVRDEFYKLDYKETARQSGVNGIADYANKASIYNGGCPMHVRATLLYNHYLKVHKIDDKYPMIGEGEKIRYVHLKKPNKIREDVIAFPVDGELPIEFGVHKNIDVEEQFNKTFLSAMEILLTPIGWRAVETSSLDEFF
jgi:DNA polymerase elongation subunit (family B)